MVVEDAPGGALEASGGGAGAGSRPGAAAATPKARSAITASNRRIASHYPETLVAARIRRERRVRRVMTKIAKLGPGDGRLPVPHARTLLRVTGPESRVKVGVGE